MIHKYFYKIFNLGSFFFLLSLPSHSQSQEQQVKNYVYSVQQAAKSKCPRVISYLKRYNSLAYSVPKRDGSFTRGTAFTFGNNGMVLETSEELFSIDYKGNQKSFQSVIKLFDYNGDCMIDRFEAVDANGKVQSQNSPRDLGSLSFWSLQLDGIFNSPQLR